MSVDEVGAIYHANQTLLTSLTILTSLGVLLAIANRLRRTTPHRATLLAATILTVIAAVLATTVSASGMWKFFTDILGPSPLRIAFFAYIEIALFASALLARARLLRDPDNGTTGIDGAAVWVLAALTATLSALDADSFREVCLRLVAPLVAAWMWERALAAERRARLGAPAAGIHWSITVERILVWLRLAEAHGRDVTEVDRARRRARLGRARLHLHLLQNKNAAAWRLRRAHHKVIRQAMRAAEHIRLADFPDAANESEAIQMYLATLYGFVDATTPDAVAHLNAWAAGTAAARPDDSTATADHRGAGNNVEPDQAVTKPRSTGSRPATTPQPLLTGGDRSSNRTTPTTVTAPRNGRSGRRTSGPAERRPARTEPTGTRTDTAVHLRGQKAARPAPLPQTRPTEPTPRKADDQDVRDVAPAGDASTSAVAAMRRFWDSETTQGRIPTGAELSRAAGVPPSTGLGRRKRREWETGLPESLKTPSAAGK